MNRIRIMHGSAVLAVLLVSVLTFFAGHTQVSAGPSSSSHIVQYAYVVVSNCSFPIPGCPLSATFSSPVAANNLLVAVVTNEFAFFTCRNLGSAYVIGDSLNNNWFPVALRCFDDGFTGIETGIWITNSTSPGPDTVTWNGDLTSNSQLTIYETFGVVGQEPTAVGDNIGIVSSNAAAFVHGTHSYDTSAVPESFPPNSILIGAHVANSGGSWTPGAGFTEIGGAAYSGSEYATSATVTSPTKFPATLSTMASLLDMGIVLVPRATTLRTTSTSLSCSPSTIQDLHSTTCTATVTDTSPGTPMTPTGTVSWSSNGPGTFSSTTCTLSGTGGTATCSVAFTSLPGMPTVITITGSYGGDADHSGSSGSTTIIHN